MKIYFTLLTAFLLGSTFLHAQNIDYQANVDRFYGSNCGNDPGWSTTEEHTWKAWLSDNINTTETYSGCKILNDNAPSTLNGNFANRTQNNTSATQLRSRIDAWEDDVGGRCSHDSRLWGADDCRTQKTCTYNLNNPLEYQWTTRLNTCGNNSYNMRVNYKYRYSTTSLSNATEYTSTPFSTGGNRPFWGSRGSWADVGNDCATSGTIGDNQRSSFSTTVSCKRQVTFRWRVSSEASYDFLEVYINGSRKKRISGNTSWATVTLDLNFSNNTIEWRYVKDASRAVGQDRGFVDNISFVDANSLNAGTITGTQTICAGKTPTSLTSTSTGEAYSNTLNYQWQFSNNNSTWTNISGATALNYTPSAGLTQTRYYRRRLQDGCGITGYSNVVTVTVNPLPSGNLTPPAPICQGSSTNLIFNASAGTGPFNIVYNGISKNNINSGTALTVSPSTSTSYSLTSITDNKGCTATSGFGSAASVVVNTLSTTPTIAPVNNKQCPNTSLTLTASGGTTGTGSSIVWYTGPNGTGTSLGIGNSIVVTPSTSTTYYARRQGTCNTTTDDTEVVSVRNYAYAPLGVSTAANYCTDNAGWHHFYNANDKIILSMRGDLTNATANPVVSINNNGSYYQTTVNAVGSCVNGHSPGDELFELPRSWNINFTGTPTGTYSIRYFFPANEKTALETAANNHITNNSACNYSHTYSNPNGFYWFKNTGTAYTAPLFDQPTKLSGSTGNIDGTHYAEITGITSFSGGSGAIRLSPSGNLPIELSSFKGWNNGSYNTIQWTTKSELNNNRFELERSTDGQQFEHITTVMGAGTTSEPQNYFHKDEAPLLGINYYRLRQVDHDGTSSLSNVIAIEVESTQGEQRFFPNPTTGKLVYQFNATHKGQIILQVHNMLGQTLDTWTHNSHVGINNKVLDWSAYPTGTYHISVYDSKGSLLHTQAVIKKMP